VTGLGGVVRQLANPKVEVVLEVPEPVWIVADRNRLTQVLVNLTVNAVEAILDGSPLHVAVANGPSHTTTLTVEEAARTSRAAARASR
jgi:signal transduction histidine kinase